MEEIKPFFKDAACICFSSDDNYSIYLYVAINSLIKNSNNNHNYEIYILDDGISNYRKEEILKLSKENVKITFIKILSYMENINKDIFYTSLHFSISTYYRFFITKIFKEFSKIIYLDTDLVILTDIYELYELDIKDNLIAACIDPITIYIVNNDCDAYDPYITQYYKNILKIKDINKYIQAGVCIFNIKELINFDFENKCINKLIEIEKPKYVDQDIINSILNGNRIFYLDLSWNVEWHFVFKKEFDIEKQNDNKPEYIKEYIKAYDNPKIMHFSSEIKPWLYDKQGSKYFWEYAINTPFYNELLLKKELQFFKDELINLKNDLNFTIMNRVSVVNKMSLIDYLFSITEDDRYKYIMILGIKITLKRKA